MSGQVPVSLPWLTVRGAGMDKTRLQGPGTAASWALAFADCSHLRLRDFAVTLPAAPDAEAAGLDLQRCAHANVTRVQASTPIYALRAYGGDDANTLTYGLTVRDCRFGPMPPHTLEAVMISDTCAVKVTGCTFTDIEAPALGFWRALEQVEVADCHFEGCTEALYYRRTTRALTVRDCTFEGHDGIKGANGMEDGSTPPPAEDVSILRCTFRSVSDAVGNGLTLYSTTGVLVEDCRFEAFAKVPIVLGLGSVVPTDEQDDPIEPEPPATHVTILRPRFVQTPGIDPGWYGLPEILVQNWSTGSLDLSVQDACVKLAGQNYHSLLTLVLPEDPPENMSNQTAADAAWEAVGISITDTEFCGGPPSVAYPVVVSFPSALPAYPLAAATLDGECTCA